MKIFYCEKENDLKAALFERIKADLARCPESFERVLLIVPAQTTLQMESEAFERMGGKGFLTFNVESGGKLREDIISETGGSGRTPIDSTGRNMLLRRVVRGCENDLQAFAAVCRDPNFLAMAADFIVQMKQNRLSADDVKKLASAQDISPLLSKKLSDMAMIADAYEQGLAGQLEDSDDLLAFTAARTSESEYIRTSRIYYYGFYSFTKNEAEFLRALDQRSAGLEIALLSGKGMEFEATRRTMAMLGCSCEKVIAENDPGQNSSSDSDPRQSVTSGSAALLPPAEIVYCANPYTQAESIAIRILNLMRVEGLRFSDFAVLTPGSGSYGSGIKRVLEGFGIPVFMDETRGLLHSSCAGLLRAVLELSAGEFRTSDIISFIRSGILAADEDLIWNFENYIKQFHIQGRRFTVPLKYRNRDFSEKDLQQFEELRKDAAEPLVSFAEAMQKAGSCRGKADVLLRFLRDTLKYPEYLEKQSSLQSEWGLAEASEETRQIWTLFEDLLAQAVQLLGSLELDTYEFKDMLLQALPDIKEGVLPQAEDRVQIGNIRRSLISEKKVIFIAGLCDGQIPSEPEASGILSDKEIAAAAERGADLSKPSELLLSEEIFMIFRALGCAGKLLWIGVPACAEDGSDLKGSPLLDTIKARCSSFTEKKDAQSDAGGSQLSLIEGISAAKTHLAGVLRDGLDGADIPDIWKAVYDQIYPEIPHIKEGLLYKRGSASLRSSNVHGLYERTDGSFSLSPSAMDVFAACPFRYFMQYGLNVKVPKDMDVASDDMGTVYHEALLALSEELSRPAREQDLAITDPRSLWMTASREQIETMLSEILERLYESAADGRLRSSAAEVYRSERMRRVCVNFALNMVQQVRLGRIDTIYSEVGFGRKPDDMFPPLELSTPAGTVYLEGRIDRVDVMPGRDGSKYIKIIDYKSGSDEFDRELVDKGLKLQLMTYLEGALGKGTDLPAGVYYFRVRETSAEAPFEDFASGEVGESPAKTINKAYMLDGVSVDDKTALSDIDTGIINGEPSSVANIKWVKANEKTGVPAHFAGDVVSSEEMEEMRRQYRFNIQALGERLYSGDVSVSPAQAKDYKPCRYCSFSGICLKDIG